jgi:lipopolysaccharide heptosyltransferase I
MAAAPSRILIIRPSALGDVCRTVPVLASLRAAWPGARIEWLVNEGFEDAVRAHPALDAVVPFPRGALRHAWRPGVGLSAVRWMQRALRAPRYDLVLDCQGLARSGLFARWTGARRRIGPASAAEFGWLGCNERVRTDGVHHVVDRMLRLVQAAGAAPRADMRLHVPPGCASSWASTRRGEGLEGGYAVFAPTSRWPSKEWPAERWASLVPEVLALGIGRVAFVGARSEATRVRAAIPADPALAARCAMLAGRTGVGELMAAIGGASLVVANDSAALHMAVGLGVPYVALFGPTDPAENGPYGGDRWVVKGDFVECEAPLHYRDRRLGDRLMRRIPVAAVASRAAEALGRGPCTAEAVRA